ncbi:unnamed protein product [Gordionus sp. m RMFG-2023]|uniref:uncharacterized protein LOC135931556 n=1 Tax=Gordionus sp. m RMFG-2023 TaxID=3053472 RepID=UPI0030DF0189
MSGGGAGLPYQSSLPIGGQIWNNNELYGSGGQLRSVFTTNMGTPKMDGPMKGGVGGVFGMHGYMGIDKASGTGADTDIITGYNRNEMKNLTADKFYALSPDRVCQLLSDDGLSVVSEVEVFIAAWVWLSADSWNRKKFIKKIMSCVRFPLFSARELYTAARELRNFPETWEFIFNANWYHSCVEFNSHDNLFFDIPKPRHFQGTRKLDPFSITRTQIGFAPQLENWRDFEMKRGNIPFNPTMPLPFPSSGPGFKSPVTLDGWLEALKDATIRLKSEIDSLGVTTRRSIASSGGKRSSTSKAKLEKIILQDKRIMSPIKELSESESARVHLKKSSSGVTSDSEISTTEPSSSEVSETETDKSSAINKKDKKDKPDKKDKKDKPDKKDKKDKSDKKDKKDKPDKKESKDTKKKDKKKDKGKSTDASSAETPKKDKGGKKSGSKDKSSDKNKKKDKTSKSGHKDKKGGSGKGSKSKGKKKK